MLYELCTVRCAREKCASARAQVGVVSTMGAAIWWSAMVSFDEPMNVSMSGIASCSGTAANTLLESVSVRQCHHQAS